MARTLGWAMTTGQDGRAAGARRAVSAPAWCLADAGGGTAGPLGEQPGELKLVVAVGSSAAAGHGARRLCSGAERGKVWRERERKLSSRIPLQVCVLQRVVRWKAFGVRGKATL